jgi:hypothetical protein
MFDSGRGRERDRRSTRWVWDAVRLFDEAADGMFEFDDGSEHATLISRCVRDAYEADLFEVDEDRYLGI